MWKYLLSCFVMLGWAFFELNGSQDFQPVLVAPVSEVAAPKDDVEPIDRSFDREEVARAATNALRSIEFDDDTKDVSHVNVSADATLWKVSADTETSAIIENMLEDMVRVVAAAVTKDENLYSVSVNRANMRNGPSTRNGVIAKFIWIMGKIARRGNQSGWLDFKKLLKKAD